MDKKKTVADFAEAFARSARQGKRPKVLVSKQHVESFLFLLGAL